jgi:hypothetical protein
MFPCSPLNTHSQRRYDQDYCPNSQNSEVSEVSMQGSVASRYSIIRDPIYQEGRTNNKRKLTMQ